MRIFIIYILTSLIPPLPYLHRIYIHIRILCYKLLLAPKIDLLIKNQLVVETPLSVKKKLLNSLTINDDSVCHIVGSGWSLNFSCLNIKSDDTVIGFNRAARCPFVKFNIYFVEIGSWKLNSLSLTQIELVRNVLSKQTKFVFFKNIWAFRNNIDFIISYWGNAVSYIRDYSINCLSVHNLKDSLEFFLEDDDNYLKQFCSSALTSVWFAKYLGFKKIVLHGIDFGGPYFYDIEGYNNRETIQMLSLSNNITIDISAGGVHPTAQLPIGLKNSLPILHALLSDQGIYLYSATKHSPLSSILPVF